MKHKRLLLALALLIIVSIFALYASINRTNIFPKPIERQIVWEQSFLAANPALTELSALQNAMNTCTVKNDCMALRSPVCKYAAPPYFINRKYEQAFMTQYNVILEKYGSQTLGGYCYRCIFKNENYNCIAGRCVEVKGKDGCGL